MTLSQPGKDVVTWADDPAHFSRPSRRDFIRVGVCGALGLTLGDLLKLEARSEQKFYESKEGQAKAIIHVVLPGGMAHQESLDPKPEAPLEYRGPFGVAKTNVKGVVLNENFSQLAKITDKLTIVRSIAGKEADRLQPPQRGGAQVHARAGHRELGLVADDADGNSRGANCVEELRQTGGELRLGHARAIDDALQLGPTLLAIGLAAQPVAHGGFVHRQSGRCPVKLADKPMKHLVIDNDRAVEVEAEPDCRGGAHAAALIGALGPLGESGGAEQVAHFRRDALGG